MLKSEEFVNINNDQESSSHDAISNKLDEIKNENGPESAPFRVNFNALSLNTEQ